MSLSTQLNRGTLALPMLLLFAALALASNEQVEPQPAPQAHAVSLGRTLDPSDCNAVPRLLLAQAPADLPRPGGACRA